MNKPVGEWIPASPDYCDIDFAAIAGDHGFREDSVREAIIAPLLTALAIVTNISGAAIT